jgi:hypothetical protein
MCLLTLWPIARALCWAWRRRLRKVERLKNEKLADVELCDVRRASSLWWSAGRGAHEPCARLRCAVWQVVDQMRCQERCLGAAEKFCIAEGLSIEDVSSLIRCVQLIYDRAPSCGRRGS